MTALVTGAADGDQRAWERLVDRYAALVWAIARNHRLGDADAADVVQTVWLRLVEHLHRIDDPRRIAAWLSTTARRECLRVLRLGGREEAVEEDRVLDRAGGGTVPHPEEAAVRQARDAVLWESLNELDGRCHALLRLLACDPPPTYEDVSAALGMPVGSIGPTRARCLAKLRKEMQARGISADILDSV